MKNHSIVLLLLVFFFSGCNKDEDFIDSLDSCSGNIVFTHFPIDMKHVINFEPLGHYNPPGHVFPSDHHYFNIEHGFGNIDIYAPCDGYIVYVTENQLPAPINKEYAFELVACKEIKIKYGHVSRLDNSILDQLGEVDNTESYSTGGQTYNLKIYETRIEVKAGQKIAELLDIPEVSGLDFGSIDTRVKLPFINPDRWENYGYINTVSFINYASSEIKYYMYNMIQFDNGEGYLSRQTPPLAGEICYDVEGTAQGMWFFEGAPTTPEDPHLGLLRNNYYPEKDVISMGTSVPGLLPIAYEFYPEDTGTHNRSFDDITADGQIYTFSQFTNIWNLPIEKFAFPSDHIILMQLVDSQTLRIEQQTTSDGPPWNFTGKAVDFNR
jgi:hypothetical protein